MHLWTSNSHQHKTRRWHSSYQILEMRLNSGTSLCGSSREIAFCRICFVFGRQPDMSTVILGNVTMIQEGLNHKPYISGSNKSHRIQIGICCRGSLNLSGLCYTMQDRLTNVRSKVLSIQVCRTARCPDIKFDTRQMGLIISTKSCRTTYHFVRSWRQERQALVQKVLFAQTG